MTKYLGIDYGKKKTGLAFADSDTRLAEPLMVISSHPRSDIVGKTTKICLEYHITAIVIGITGGYLEPIITHFGQQLTQSTGLTVIYADETLTTYESNRLMVSLGKKRSWRHQNEDAIAAAIMLQSFLEGGTDV